jgi:hypothetical protein
MLRAAHRRNFDRFGARAWGAAAGGRIALRHNGAVK